MPLSLSVFNIFWTMLLTGLGSFGGGIGAVNIMRDVAVFNNWINEVEFLRVSGIAQISGYSQGIVMAGYIGSKVGIIGTVTGIISFILPTIVIYFFLFKLIQKWYKHEFFRTTLRFINLCFVGYIAVLFYNFLLTIFSIDPIFYIALAAIVCYLNLIFDINPVILIAGGAIVGIIFRSTSF